MKKSLLILSLLFLVFPTLMAGDRTEQQMKESAAKVLNKNMRRASGNRELKELRSLSKLKIYGYDEGGFAVVTKDDRFEDVIGYSASKCTEEMPCGFKWWLETSNEVMENYKGQVPAKTIHRSPTNRAGVGPLITTKWGQGKPFNNKCKITIEGKEYSLLTGCGATAMAQIMNYYKYPAKGKGKNSYKINYTDWGEQAYYANFDNSYYDWDNMLDDYSGYSLKPEDKYTDAVSLLMSDCGKAVNMIYRTWASSAYTYRIPIGFENYFSYSFIDENNTTYYRSSYSENDWMNLIFNALDNGHPIFYFGNNNGKDGHFFVIHGYEPDGKVIVNWGWNGSYDGSFMIDMLSPRGYVFNDNQQMIIPIPKVVDANVYKLTYIINGEVYKEYELKAGAEITPEPAPTKEGYTFSGWSAIPQTMPANNLTITGSFTKGSYKLTYIIDDEVYKTINYDFGTTITPEASPTKVGYTFSGWSEIPKTMPAKDVMVTGRFTINKYKLTYKVDGEVYKIYEIEYGAKITPEAGPTKDGYKFLGWSNIPSTMPNHDVTIIGEFTQELIIYGSILKSNGLLYKVIDDYVLVGRQDKGLSGSIVIPASISYENKTYPVLGFVEPTNLTAWSSNTVTTEGGAFQDCQITSVVIPSSITKITAGAFNGCTKLKTVTMPNNLESIGAASFASCTALETLSIPDGVKEFGSDSRYGFVSYTFGNCRSLKTINIPSGISILYEGCFMGAGLDSVYIPKSIASLRANSLALPNLRVVKTEIKDPTKISYSQICFASVSNADLYVPKGSLNAYKEYEPWSNFRSILEYGEDGEIIIPSQMNITYDGIKYILKDGVAIIGRQDKSLSGDIIIPDKISYNGTVYKVTEMVTPTDLTCYSSNTIVCVGGAFQGSSIESITLPNTINTISAGAFQDCKLLKKVILPETIKMLSAACFAGCSNLEIINIPDGLTDLASYTRYGYRSYVFGGCTKIKVFEIPSGVRTLASGCFLNSGIETVSIPAGCTQMDEDCLDAPNLRTVTMYVRDLDNLSYTESCFGEVSNTILRVPKGSKQVYQEYYPWMSFASIEEFDDGNGVFVPSKITTRIDNIRYILSGDNAKIGRQNKDLSGNIIIPSSVSFGGKEYIVNGMVEPTNLIAWSSNTVSTENGAFQSCPITSITIPSNIGTISAGAFYNCQELEKVSIAEGITQLGAACFAGCTKLVEIQIPESVTEFGSYTRYGFKSYIFGNCSSLKKVNIPNKVTQFTAGCFKGSGLEIFIIPSNILELEQDCFSMNNLKGIKITHTDLNKLTYTESIFSNVSNVSLYVPEGTSKIYKEFYPWKNFKEIVEYKDQNDEFLFNAYGVSYILADNVSNSNRSVSDSDNGNIYLKNYCASGINLESVEVPTKEGYTFSGWSGIPETMPAHDVNVIGSYTVNEYKLTYMIDGKMYKEYVIKYGSDISAEEDPQKETYQFSGWSEIPNTMPAHDVIITGSFERVFNVGHVANVVNYIMNKNATGDDIALYDMNNDGELNIGDIILIVKSILNNVGTTSKTKPINRRSSEVIDLTQYTAAQFVVRTTDNTGINDFHLVKSLEQTHQLMYQQIDANTYAVVVFSLMNHLMSPESGNIIEIETNKDNNIPTIDNLILAKPSGEINYYQTMPVSTSIRQIEDENVPAVIYDLKGNRQNGLKGLKKNVYIINGKLTVVK